MTIADATWPYDGNGSLLKLGLQTHSFGIAHEFGPYLHVSTSTTPAWLMARDRSSMNGCLRWNWPSERESLLRQPDILVNLPPADIDGPTSVASLSEDDAWLNQHALTSFLNEVCEEGVTELDRIAEHIELSLVEVLHRTDLEIGRAAEEVENQVTGTEGCLPQAESRHDEATARRDLQHELAQQGALTLQSVERLTSILVLHHPQDNDPEVKRLRPDAGTEMTAMRLVMEYEQAQGRQVEDVREKNLGCDLTALDVTSGKLRLIEGRVWPMTAALLLAVCSDQLRRQAATPRTYSGPGQLPVVGGKQDDVFLVTGGCHDPADESAG